jgi:methyltransferase
LTELLLLEDFGIRMKIPNGYLVPRVPQRLNYILVLEDILRLNDIENVVGLDIGE